RLGKRITLGGTPAAAAPEGDNMIVVVQIKVMAMFISRLLFKFGALANESDVSNGAVLSYTGTTTAAAPQTGRYGVPWGPRDANFSGINDPNAGLLGTFSNGASDLSTFFMGKGIDLVSNVPRWRKLRFNRWWASILESGKAEAELGNTRLGDPTIY